MSLRRTLDVMAVTVGRAASVPLSASCLVNRAELLSLVERAKAELPAELDEAAALLVAHQEVIEEAERERDQIIADARVQVQEMLSESAVVATADAHSAQILAAARAEAARLLREADRYCDSRLESFESELDRLTGQVRRGRERLKRRSELEDLELQESLTGGLGADTGNQPGSQVGSQAGSQPAKPAAEPADQPFDGQSQDAESVPEHDPTEPFPVQAGPDRLIDLTAVERAGARPR